MSAFLRKYATATSGATNIGIPMPKAGSADFAAGGDWSPAGGDVRVSIDGGSQANIASLPSYANGQWSFTFTAAELTGKRVAVAIIDSATKVVDDQFFVVETYGNAAAMIPFDFGSPTVTVGTVAAGATNVKKATALAGFAFVMTDSTNHNPATGLSVSATRSLDGAAFVACANPVTSVANGAYKVDLAASDTNANVIMFRFFASGADDLFLSLITQP